jgi:hypothetical protein
LPTGSSSISRSPVEIVSNRHDLEATGSHAFCFGSLLVRYSGTKLLNASEREFPFQNSPGDGEFRFQNSPSADVTVTNEASDKKKAAVTWLAADGRMTRVARELGPEEIWNLRLPNSQ